MLQTHYFDLLSKNFGNREKLIIVLKQNNGEPSVIVPRILHICKTGVVTTIAAFFISQQACSISDFHLQNEMSDFFVPLCDT